MNTHVPESPAVQSILDLKEALEALPSSARFSQAEIDTVYAMAYQLAAQQRYESARQYFSLLTLYRPTNITYLQGMALCHRMLEHYDEALNVYSFLAVIDPENMGHEIAIAECLMLRSDFEEARTTVNHILQYCKESGQTPPSGERAQVLKERLDARASVATAGD